MVCDGFVGNVVLKTVEGKGHVMGNLVKEMFMKNILTKLGGLFALKGVKQLKKTMDYRSYGGAPLLGTKKPVIKGHGSSDAKAVYNAVVQAKKFVETNVIDEIVKNVNGGEANG